MANKLCGVASELLEFIDYLKHTMSTTSETTDGNQIIADETVSSEVLAISQQLQRERLQLVEAWTALEREQRELAIQSQPTQNVSRGAPTNRISTQAPQANPKQRAQALPNATLPSTITDSVSACAMDAMDQFRLLQRECDRQSNSS